MPRQYEIVTPEKTHGPIDDEGSIKDWIRTLGLSAEDEDQENGWFVQLVGSDASNVN